MGGCRDPRSLFEARTALTRTARWIFYLDIWASLQTKCICITYGSVKYDTAVPGLRKVWQLLLRFPSVLFVDAHLE